MRTVSEPGEHQAEKTGETALVITVSLPVPESARIDEQTARELLVIALVDRGRLSQSQAARALGVSRHDLLDLMGRHGAPILRYGEGELEQESRHLQELQAIRREQAVKPSSG